MKTDASFLTSLADAFLQELGSFEKQERAIAQLKSVSEAFAIEREGRDLPPSALRSGLKGHVDEQVLNLLLLLRERTLLRDLPRFLDRLARKRQELGEAREATVTSVTPLTKEEKETLRETLQKKWSVNVSLREEVDPTIIGGLRVTSGDWQFDSTVQGRVARLALAIKH